jgi:KEOPS complex subunit Cgi121
MIKIVGAKGDIKSIDNFLEKLESFAKNQNIVIQAFNADVIYGKNHIISAVEHAIRAMDGKTNTTNSLGMEILLYSSGERQLKIAIPKMGVKKGKANIAFVFTSEKISDQIINDLLGQLSLVRDDEVIDGNIDTLKKFGISENEINTVTKAKYGDLILEKVAMVDIIK